MNSVMKYLGYSAKIEYSADDECFVGQVLGITDTLVFDGESVSELEESFHTCIDEYLEFCEEIGKKPEKEFKGTFNVRINPELHRQAAIAASLRHISLNSFVESSIERALIAMA